MAVSRLCSIPDCGKAHKGHGYCHVHLRRWKRNGDPLMGRKYPRRGEPLEYLIAHMWDDCPKWPYSRGNGGYGHIQHNGKVRDVHRVVCEMVYGPPPSEGHEVAHACGKGHEGCFGAHCLSWKTLAGNRADMVLHGTQARGVAVLSSKLTEADIRQIRSLAGTKLHREIAGLFGVSRPHISGIISGRAWSWFLEGSEQ